MADYSTTYLKIYRYNADWSNKTESYSEDILEGWTVVKPCVHVFSGRIDVIFGEYNLVTRLYPRYSTDGGATWNTYWPFGDDTITATTNFSVFEIGAARFIQMDQTSGHMRINKYTPAGATYEDGAAGKSTRGYSDGTYLWYLTYDSATVTYTIKKFDGTNFTTDSTPTLTGGADLDFASGLFWKNGTSMLVGWKNNLWYYENATIGWKKINDVSSSNPVPAWYLDGSTLKIKYFGYGNRIVYFDTKGSLVQIVATTTLSFLCAWDSYFIDSNKKVYKLTMDTVSDCAKCEITTEVQLAPTCKYSTRTTPITNEYIKLYSDADVLLYQGWFRNPQFDGSEYHAELLSPTISDLDAIVNEDWTATTETVIIKDILDTYCYFLTYDGTSIGGSGTAINFKGKGLSVKECLTRLAIQDVRGWYIEPDFVVHFNTNAIDSTLDFLKSTTEPGLTMNSPPHYVELKYSKAEAWGKGVSGARLYSERFGEAGYSNIKLYNASATTQAELDAWLDNFLTVNNATVKQYDLEYSGKGMPQVGLTATFEWNIAPWSVVSAEHYIKRVIYDALADSIDSMILHDVFYHSIDPKNQVDLKLEDLSQMVVQTAEDVNGKVSDTAYAGSWDTVTTVAPSKNAVYDRVQAISVQGTEPVIVGGDHNAHILDANHAIALENDNGDDITAIQRTLTDTDTQLPTSGAVVDYALPLSYLETAITDSDTKVDSSKDLMKHLMIGSANAAWIPCILIGSNTHGLVGPYNTGFANLGTTSDYFMLVLPLPTNRGGKKLYIDGYQFGNYNANATNFITLVQLQGLHASVCDGIYTDNTDWTTQAANETDFDGQTGLGPYDCSSYRQVGLLVQFTVNANQALKIYSFCLHCYYDT